MNFIELPIILLSNTADELNRYEELGIKPPEENQEVVLSLVNLDMVEMINPVNDEEIESTIRFDGFDYRCKMSYKDIKKLVVYFQNNPNATKK